MASNKTLQQIPMLKPAKISMINGPRARSLGSFIGGYKSTVTGRVNRTESVGATGRSPEPGAPEPGSSDGTVDTVCGS
ncbi:MAG: hypothetical protein HN350_03670 [Phycisphaerales bacterium]|nr:hypothetical protein [Phycisphaerales bacterium]